MKKYLSKTFLLGLMFSFLILFIPEAKAQTGVITGKVTSQASGGPLVGCTIAEMDKDGRYIGGVVTDINGNFSLRMADVNNTLSISYIGFIAKKEIPGNRTQLNISLEEQIIGIGNVEVSGIRSVNTTGTFTMDPIRVATAVATINTREFSEMASTSVIDQMQGRLSGVDIVAESGEPGAGMSIRIRGTSSLNASSQPLIVINGVPYETQVDKSFDFASADEQAYAAMIGVSTDDIEEISVLKDAAATAQYGSRAANGVLLISTKRGSRGATIFNYSYKGTLSAYRKGYPMLDGNQYPTLMKEELFAVNDRTLHEEINFNPDWENYNLYNKNVNWFDEIKQLGWINEHNFSVSGGGEKASYRVSSSIRGERGTIIGSGANLFTARAILDYNISDKLRISSELSYTHGAVERSGASIDLALRKMPNMSIWNLDAEGNSTGTYYTPVDAFQGSGTTYYNPVAMANLSDNNSINDRISPLFRITYRATKSLNYEAYVSFDMSNTNSNSFTPEEAIGAAWTNSSANKASLSSSEFYVLHTMNNLVFNPKLGDNHSLYLGLRFETDDKINQDYEAVTSNAPSQLLQIPIVISRMEGDGNSLNSSFSESRTLGFNFIFNYQFKDRYIISGGVRSEGNSRFGDNYKYGTFPSIALKWIISREAFMKQFTFIDEFSIRASYGVNGSSPGMNYGAYNTYSTYGYNYIDVRPVYPSSVELVKLKWETVIQKNIGLNLIMFDNRINADLELYIKSTKDILNKNTSIPSASGFSELPYLNLGDIDNRGIEFSVMTTVIKTSDLRVSFNFNIARNINLIKRISEAMDVEDGNPLTSGSGGYLKRIQVDNPIGSFYGYRYMGVFSTPDDLYAKDASGNTIYDLDGRAKIMRFNNSRDFTAGDAIYEDVNHDGNINRMDVVYLGNANPLLFGGFGPNISYKGIQLNVFFNFRYKQKVINLARMALESMTNYDNQTTTVLRRWRAIGDVTDIPKAYFNNPVNNLASDRYMEDASFLRMKTVTLKYTLPKSLVSKVKFKNAYLYLTGQNLMTFTRYLGLDPETGTSDNWKSLGYDSSRTPRSNQYTVGINVQF